MRGGSKAQKAQIMFAKQHVRSFQWRVTAV